MTAQRIPYHEILGAEITYANTPTSAVYQRWTQADQLSVLQGLNNEVSSNKISLSSGTNQTQVWTMLHLPDPYDVTGYFAAYSGAQSDSAACEVWYKQLGGSWTKWVEHGAMWGDNVAEAWETGIVTPGSPLTNIVGVGTCAKRPYGTFYQRAMHFYGTPTDATGMLRLWHPTLDEDYGDALDFGSALNPGATSTLQFRVKNLHVLQAEPVVLSAYDLTGDMADGIAFSDDDVTYTATLDIGNLAAGAISPVCYAKRTVPDPVAYKTQASYVAAEATAWA